MISYVKTMFGACFGLALRVVRLASNWVLVQKSTSSDEGNEVVTSKAHSSRAIDSEFHSKRQAWHQSDIFHGLVVDIFTYKKVSMSCKDTTIDSIPIPAIFSV